MGDATNPNTHNRPSIILDGVFFQFRDQSGIFRVWSSLLKQWSGTPFGKSLLVIDREEAAPKFPGITYVPYKNYDSSLAAGGSFELEDFCRQHQAKLFVSTFYSMPLETPSVAMVHDTITERFPGNDPKWCAEKRYTTHHASAYIAVSNKTRDDLYEMYPAARGLPLRVAHHGVSDAFLPLPPNVVADFKQRHGIHKPYFLSVGRRDNHKNIRLFFEAFSRLPGAEDIAIVCCGGNPYIESELTMHVEGKEVFLLKLSDSDLNAAYSGALALVYPSLYEGFGLPIIEAMASGCPVITCRNGSIPEVAGNAAYFVDDSDVTGMLQALVAIQQPEIREPLVGAGFRQASRFSWSTTAEIVSLFLTTMAARDYSLPELRRDHSGRLWRQLRDCERELENISPRLRRILQRPELQIHMEQPPERTNRMEQLRSAWLQSLAEDNCRLSAGATIAK